MKIIIYFISIMFRTGQKPTSIPLTSTQTTKIGSLKNYITQTPTSVAVVKGDVVIAKNFTYRNRFS